MSESQTADLRPPLALPRAVAAQPRRGSRLPVASWSERVLPRFGILATGWRSRRARRRAASAATVLRALESLDASELAARRRDVAARLRRRGFVGRPLVEGLAIAAETSRRVLGLVPYPGQLAAAAGLVAGEVVEMDTGEGKTLSAFLAAATCALAGRSVHVVTANDYLAERDGAFLQPAFASLGLTTGVVVATTPVAARRAAYRAHVTFLSGKEAAFDYLRDGLSRGSDTRDRNLAVKLLRALGDPLGTSSLQTDLDVVLIDEIDNVLIDEAGTPLIISADAGADGEKSAVALALKIAQALREGRHYRLSASEMMPEFTEDGAAEIDRVTRGASGLWRMRLRREELVRAAIAAQQRLLRDRDYIVREGKVVIVDPHSGRTMSDRQWGHDLHAMVEAKEGLKPSGRRKALASISFQRFFRTYQHVAGMSGTVREVAGELAVVYGLQLTRVTRRLPLRRAWAGRHVFADRDALWASVGADVVARHARGQPVMVAVRSVAEADRAAQELDRRRIPYKILSAAHDREEAEIVANAGQRGAITIVTNMAGRGTDIKLGPGVAACGGLAVLICERHESRRVDRQLMGRAARQGDPGVVTEFLSARDGLLDGLGPIRSLLRSAPLRRIFGGLLFRRQQLTAERLAARRRFDLVRRDEQLARTLAFADGLD